MGSSGMYDSCVCVLCLLQAELPTKLLDRLLIRTIVAFNKTMKSHDANVVAVTTVSSVCSLWWHIIDSNKWNRQRIRHLLHCNFLVCQI